MIKYLKMPFIWFSKRRRKTKITNSKSVAGLIMELKRGLQSERLSFNVHKYKEAKRINGELLKMISSVKMKGVE